VSTYVAVSRPSDAQLKERFALTRVQVSVGVSPLSSAGNMNTQVPRLYHSAAGYYYVVADWGWTSNNWKTDAPQSYGNVGGIDIHSVWFSQTIQNLGGAMTVCGAQFGGHTTPGCFDTSSYETNNQYGTAIQFQDRAQNHTFHAVGDGYTNADRGSLTFKFNRTRTGCLQFGAKYGHTWSSTSVSGVGISIGGVAISWTSSANAWGDASAVGSLTC
jgi:hypothetical protein